MLDRGCGRWTTPSSILRLNWPPLSLILVLTTLALWFLPLETSRNYNAITNLAMSFELPSVRSLSGLLSQIPLLFQTQSQVASPQNAVSTPYGNAPSCPVDSPLSCHNTTIAPDSCCFIYPGGQLLQTQFWDTNPTVGPNNSWTLHGLWFAPFDSHCIYLIFHLQA